MKRIFPKYLFLLLIPLGIAIGTLREIQIDTYLSSIGMPTMSGAFTFMADSALGIYSGIILFLIASICSNKSLTRILKSVIITLITLISIPILFFIIFFIGIG